MPVNTQPDDSFKISQAMEGGNPLRAYVIESTAPLNVGRPAPLEKAVASVASATSPASPPPLLLKDLTNKQGIAQIAKELLFDEEGGELVITIHGFNNPYDIALASYQRAFEFVRIDAAIQQNEARRVNIGYIWPSEKIGQPKSTFWQAASEFLRWLLRVGVILVAISLVLGPLTALLRSTLHPQDFWASTLTIGSGLLRMILYVAGLLALAVPFAAFLERLLVYFRDGYRATHYGVPDLVEVIRQIDHAIIEKARADKTASEMNARPSSSLIEKARVDRTHAPTEEANELFLPDERRVRLSFIGHSLGAFVVTSVVRILTDVFDPKSIPPLSNGADGATTPDAPLNSNIGHALCLGRLVLVSPDIPAEALLTQRANFLRSSLRRFEEAYLFSNEGDIVLRMISTLANYFSFPTTDSRFGFRLGNVALNVPSPVSDYYGQNLAEKKDILQIVRLGSNSLETLEKAVSTEEKLHRRESESPKDAKAAPSQKSSLPYKFNYFDCTDYIDAPKGAKAPDAMPPKDMSPYLTRALGVPILSRTELLRLLKLYVSSGSAHVDVHSGYFRGDVMQALIYRFACLGGKATFDSFGPKTALDDVCKKHQIRFALARKPEAHV